MNVAASGVYGKDKICDLNFKRKVAELWSKSLMVDCNLKAPLPLSLSSSLDQIFATTIMNEKNVAELILSQSQGLSSTGNMNSVIVEACSSIWVKADAIDCTHEAVRNSLVIDPPIIFELISWWQSGVPLRTFLLDVVVTMMLKYFVQLCLNKKYYLFGQ